MPRSVDASGAEYFSPTAFNFGVPPVTKKACLVRPFLVGAADAPCFLLPRAPISTFQAWKGMPMLKAADMVMHAVRWRKRRSIRRLVTCYQLSGASLSLSAMRLSSGSEPAFIFRIRRLRCTFTVPSARPISTAICLHKRPCVT
jgi:hypothetical protein